MMDFLNSIIPYGSDIKAIGMMEACINMGMQEKKKWVFGAFLRYGNCTYETIIIKNDKTAAKKILYQDFQKYLLINQNIDFVSLKL